MAKYTVKLVQAITAESIDFDIKANTVSGIDLAATAFDSTAITKATMLVPGTTSKYYGYIAVNADSYANDKLYKVVQIINNIVYLKQVTLNDNDGIQTLGETGAVNATYIYNQTIVTDDTQGFHLEQE